MFVFSKLTRDKVDDFLLLFILFLFLSKMFLLQNDLLDPLKKSQFFPHFVNYNYVSVEIWFLIQ